MRQKNSKALEYKKALVYCRVSSQRQVNEGHGLDSQEVRCINYAKANGWEVVKIFRDEGVSGGLFDRPAIQELIKYLDKQLNENYVVIFDDLKRFARDVQVHLRLRAELVGRGVKLECLNFRFEDTPEGRFVENIIAATGQLDLEQNKRQVKQKQRARLELGYWPFCPPPGLKNINKVLVPDEPLASIYQAAILKFKNYELNTFEDVRKYILSQYRSFGIKRKLSLHGTINILSQILYTGYIEYEPWGFSRIKGQHNGIISLDTFYEVQRRIQNRAKPRLRKDYNQDFPLRNYVLCEDCHKPLTAAWYTGRTKKYAKYTCKTLGCQYKGKTIDRNVLHRHFEQLLYKIRPKKKF